MSISGSSKEESWIKDTSSAKGGAEKVTRLVGENRGEGADVCWELRAITRQSLTSDATFLNYTGSENPSLGCDCRAGGERHLRMSCSDTQQTDSSFLQQIGSFHDEVIVP